MNLGHEIEDIVENLCKRSFFADFTIRNPKYRKLGGQEKEAADLLVLFDNTLIAIQVKGKEIDPHSQPSEVDRERVSRTLEKAILQFRALGEALKNPSFNSFKNGRGIEIAFERKQITEIILIVVFAPTWKGTSRDSAEIRLDKSCDPDFPIHFFTLKQFSMLLNLLNTLPDFLFYLEARWALYSENLIPADSDPIDEWAFITFEKKKFLSIAETKVFTPISGLGLKHRSSLKQLERKEKPSYFVDKLIENLYAAIGSALPVDARFNLLADPNSLTAYNLVIFHLAKLNRRDRAQLSEFLLNRIIKCHNQEIAFRGFKFSETSKDAYLVLASRFERKERRIALSNIGMGMGYKLGVKKVIGIAASHDWPASPECDVALVNVSKLKPTSKLVEMTNMAFSKRILARPRDL